MTRTMMKVEIHYRDPMDGETVGLITKVEVPVIGNVKVYLTKDEMGNVIHENSVVEPSEEFLNVRKNVKDQLEILRTELACFNQEIGLSLAELHALAKFLKD